MIIMTYYVPPMFTLRDFREQTKDLPDETLIVGELEAAFQYNEVSNIEILPAKDVYPPVIVVNPGQEVTIEWCIAERVEESLGIKHE